MCHLGWSCLDVGDGNLVSVLAAVQGPLIYYSQHYHRQRPRTDEAQFHITSSQGLLRSTRGGIGIGIGSGGGSGGSGGIWSSTWTHHEEGPEGLLTPARKNCIPRPSTRARSVS
jgi:hypothetical protein